MRFSSTYRILLTGQVCSGRLLGRVIQSIYRYIYSLYPKITLMNIHTKDVGWSNMLVKESIDEGGDRIGSLAMLISENYVDKCLYVYVCVRVRLKCK